MPSTPNWLLSRHLQDTAGNILRVAPVTVNPVSGVFTVGIYQSILGFDAKIENSGMLTVESTRALSSSKRNPMVIETGEKVGLGEMIVNAGTGVKRSVIENILSVSFYMAYNRTIASLTETWIGVVTEYGWSLEPNNNVYGITLETIDIGGPNPTLVYN